MSDKYGVSHYENPENAVVDGETNTTHPEFEGIVVPRHSRRDRGLPPSEEEGPDVDIDAILELSRNFQAPKITQNDVTKRQAQLSRLYKLLKLLKKTDSNKESI